MDNNQPEKTGASPNLAGTFAGVSTCLAVATVAAVFNDATAPAAICGVLTGISLPITGFALFAKGMSA